MIVTLMSRPGIANRVIDIVVDAQRRGLGLLAHRKGKIIIANHILEGILECEVRPGMHINDLIHLSPVGYFRMARAVLSRRNEPYMVKITTPFGKVKDLMIDPSQVNGVRIVKVSLVNNY